jgi:hypothetical protein
METGVDVEITDQELLNESVAAGEEVVVRVDLANFHPARGEITLNLTTDFTLAAQRTLTVGVDERRTVYLRTVPDAPGEYDLRLNGVSVGTLTVTAADGPTTASTDRPAESSPSTETDSGTPAPTPGPTSTDGEPPSGDTETASSSSVGTGTATPEVGPAPPTGTDTVLAGGMSLLLLYGVGIAVYVLRENPPGGLG